MNPGFPNNAQFPNHYLNPTVPNRSGIAPHQQAGFGGIMPNATMGGYQPMQQMELNHQMIADAYGLQGGPMDPMSVTAISRNDDPAYFSARGEVEEADQISPSVKGELPGNNNQQEPIQIVLKKGDKKKDKSPSSSSLSDKHKKKHHHHHDHHHHSRHKSKTKSRKREAHASKKDGKTKTKSKKSMSKKSASGRKKKH